MTKSETQVINASFRDPDGFLFNRSGDLYRQINKSGAPAYQQLMESGLYKKLVEAQQIVLHREVDIEPVNPNLAYKIIQPVKIPFISYPYEWSFSMLKDAALTTLSIQLKALEAGMILKDASAYNIQFLNGKPVLIDTLSFEPYVEGKPWVAYQQFCQHFMAPLALMAKVDIRLGQLLRIYIDGIPLDLAARMLPGRVWTNPGLMVHIGFHSHAQKSYASKSKGVTKSVTRPIKKDELVVLVESLYNTIYKLNWKPSGTEWADYYNQTNYSKGAFDHKRLVLNNWIEKIDPGVVWDLGSNTGEFSRIASQKGCFTIAFDRDPGAVEKNYQQIKQEGNQKLLPLIQDLTNPSPSIGWANFERDSLTNRGPADLILGLALIHHLTMTNNTPLNKISDYLRTLGHSLIIEFVPKSDSQVQKMLANRVDIFPDYTPEGFESAFNKNWEFIETVPLAESERILYLLKGK